VTTHNTGADGRLAGVPRLKTRPRPAIYGSAWSIGLFVADLGVVVGAALGAQALTETPLARLLARDVTVAPLVFGTVLWLLLFSRIGMYRRSFSANARMAVSAYNSGSPTAPGTLTTWNDGQTLSYADSVFRHYAQLGGDPQAQLLADNRENASDVNALAVLRRKQSPPAFSAGPYLAAGNAAATLPPAMPFAPSAPAPSSNGPSRTVADSAGTQADHLYASLVDLGDGFDNPSDDDT